MIGYFGTTEAVANYNVVFPLANVLTLVFTSFSFLFMPVLSELHAEGRGDELHRLYTVVTKWIFLGTLPLFLLFVFFPNEAISYTFGSNYSEAGTALTVLAVGFFSHTLVGPNESTLNSIGATKQVMYDNITAAVVNVIINLLLIPRYGIIGAAAGTTVAYIILNSLYSYHVFVLTEVHPFSMAMLKPGIGGIVIGLVVYFILTSTFQITPLVLVTASLVYAMLYTVAVLLLGGIEREEVMLVLSFEERFGVDLGPLKRVVNRLL
jgi:O-antigen/teichoic acid export membrane protein